MKTRILLCLIAMAFPAHAADILIKQITTAMPLASDLQFRDSKYFVTADSAEKLPAFDPTDAECYFPIPKALAVAFNAHFAKHGISRDRFYREVQVSLEKVDDYTASAVADGVRRESASIRSLWFYVISCEHTAFGQTKPDPAPALVLMDGSIVLPRDQLRGLP